MTVNDFNTNENPAPKKGAEEAAVAGAPDERSESSQIKNAHATGDGSFGRSDENLPDGNDPEKNEPVNKDGSDEY